jgi:hypothetical protein
MEVAIILFGFLRAHMGGRVKHPLSVCRYIGAHTHERYFLLCLGSFVVKDGVQ